MRGRRGVRSRVFPIIGIFIARVKREYRPGPHEYLRKLGSVHESQLEVRWARVVGGWSRVIYSG
jgi:hypothetical protein